MVPEVQLFEGFQAAHASWHPPEHVVCNVQALQLAKLPHALWQAVQIVGPQVKLHKKLARSNLVWQSFNAVVLKPQHLEACHLGNALTNL